MCLLYGTDKAAYADLMKQLKVPATRLARCEIDAHRRFTAWKSLLAPHAVKP